MALIKGRRWASRKPRQLRKRGKEARNQKRDKSKVPRKPRLIRRHKRYKLDDTNAHFTAITPHTATAINTLLEKMKTGSRLPVALPHNDVVDERRTTTHPAVIAEVSTYIPNPTPETGGALTGNSASSTSDTLGAGSPLLGGQTFSTATAGLSIINPTTISPLTSATKASLHTIVSSFSELPPLPSLTSSLLASAALHPASIPSSTGAGFFPSPSPDPDPSGATDATASRQISVAMVILVSVGGALLLLGFCIVVKMCTRPRKRPRPKPSLPILKGEDKDEDYFETKESPLFGGRERMSDALAASGPNWNWVQYPHTKLSGPTGTPLEHAHPAQQNFGMPDMQYSSGPAYDEPRFNLATRAPDLQPVSSVHQMPQHAPFRSAMQDNPPPSAMKRMSRQSMSFYATSPLHDIREETAYTGGGNDVLKRSRSKTASRRYSQPDVDERKQRNSTVSFVGLAYDGEDTTSSSPMEYGHVIQDTPVLNSDFAGRARVKSGYFATGTYPRTSTMPNTSYSIATATRINVGQRDSKILNQKSNTKGMRDTQALTYALGLSTPRPEYGGISPQVTLYPDDSVSVNMDGRRLKSSVTQKKMAVCLPDIPVLVPTGGGDGALNSLMGMNFGMSQMSLSALHLGRVSEGDEKESQECMSSSSSGRSMRVVVDKAPRVPSPPPLPSLAQMGLARNNPEAYDNYRSPTYSLYGLYQTADRKSFVGR